ncbi:predicted protein [Postia placenta Mad-698-R]|uniref:Sm domain-containing protein n=1 Tax=Postia placenta MAD-698-R-SB12 TaxID=670580 RepID=A0A1X6NHF2_9APHY|nr:hypothetical protein POSPLADRAFT_1043204 [Postia placenta MAD-698-R-SB12]EED84753.1 predicted protein [Postia placenta Mad-698-R]OSX68044.1 hypothetical protein POSPLADRAFT_1043204 [Postia placenta MAD-698-R-SB12]
MAESHTSESLEDTALSRPSTPESVWRLKSLLQQLLRVTILDGRIFLGTFVGTDQQLNILLVNSEEYRIGPESVDGDPNGRFVGQLMVPWRLIKTVEASTNAGGALLCTREGERRKRVNTIFYQVCEENADVLRDTCSSSLTVGYDSSTLSSVAIHYPHASKPGLKLVSKRYSLAHKRSSAGLTLIFAHCTGAHKELWEPVIENLLQREDNTSLAVREAWSIDWQSHGEAAELNEHVLGTDADGLSVQEWATGIQGLINSKLLAGHRLVCIGHSAGATAMLLAVAALPQADTRIKGIVLLEPSLITRDEFHKHLRERTAALDFMQKAVAGRRAEWNTREDAMQYFKKRMPWKIWDPRVLNLFVSRPMASEMCPPRIKNAPGKSH